MSTSNTKKHALAIFSSVISKAKQFQSQEPREKSQMKPKTSEGSTPQLKKTVSFKDSLVQSVTFAALERKAKRQPQTPDNSQPSPTASPRIASILKSPPRKISNLTPALKQPQQKTRPTPTKAPMQKKSTLPSLFLSAEQLEQEDTGAGKKSSRPAKVKTKKAAQAKKVVSAHFLGLGEDDDGDGYQDDIGDDDDDDDEQAALFEMFKQQQQQAQKVPSKTPPHTPVSAAKRPQRIITTPHPIKKPRRAHDEERAMEGFLSFDDDDDDVDADADGNLVTHQPAFKTKRTVNLASVANDLDSASQSDSDSDSDNDGFTIARPSASFTRHHNEVEEDGFLNFDDDVDPPNVEEYEDEDSEQHDLDTVDVEMDDSSQDPNDDDLDSDHDGNIDGEKRDLGDSAPSIPDQHITPKDLLQETLAIYETHAHLNDSDSVILPFYIHTRQDGDSDQTLKRLAELQRKQYQGSSTPTPLTLPELDGYEFPSPLLVRVPVAPNLSSRKSRLLYLIPTTHPVVSVDNYDTTVSSHFLECSEVADRLVLGVLPRIPISPDALHESTEDSSTLAPSYASLMAAPLSFSKLANKELSGVSRVVTTPTDLSTSIQSTSSFRALQLQLPQALSPLEQYSVFYKYIILIFCIELIRQQQGNQLYRKFNSLFAVLRDNKFNHFEQWIMRSIGVDDEAIPSALPRAEKRLLAINTLAAGKVPITPLQPSTALSPFIIYTLWEQLWYSYNRFCSQVNSRQATTPTARANKRIDSGKPNTMKALLSALTGQPSDNQIDSSTTLHLQEDHASSDIPETVQQELIEVTQQHLQCGQHNDILFGSGAKTRGDFGLFEQLTQRASEGLPPTHPDYVEPKQLIFNYSRLVELANKTMTSADVLVDPLVAPNLYILAIQPAKGSNTINKRHKRAFKQSSSSSSANHLKLPSPHQALQHSSVPSINGLTLLASPSTQTLSTKPTPTSNASKLIHVSLIEMVDPKLLNQPSHVIKQCLNNWYGVSLQITTSVGQSTITIPHFMKLVMLFFHGMIHRGIAAYVKQYHHTKTPSNVSEIIQSTTTTYLQPYHGHSHLSAPMLILLETFAERIPKQTLLYQYIKMLVSGQTFDVSLFYNTAKKKKEQLKTTIISASNMSDMILRMIALVVIRYELIQGERNNKNKKHGGGNQAAVPQSFLYALARHFHIDAEAFASPLNTQFTNYCSAFMDVDAPFNSLGSFFHFRPRMGNFFVNPPFVDETILAALVHAEQLLAASIQPAHVKTTSLNDKGLMFIFVFPWAPHKMSTQFAITSPYCTMFTVLPEREHFFTTGLQHHGTLKSQSYEAIANQQQHENENGVMSAFSHRNMLSHHNSRQSSRHPTLFCIWQNRLSQQQYPTQLKSLVTTISHMITKQ